MTADIHTDRALAETLAQTLANTIKVPCYVVEQHGTYFVQDEEDVSCYWYNPESGTLMAEARIVSTFRPLAQTRQSLAIESRLSTCRYCRSNHHIQRCPQLHAALFDDVSAELGGMLCALLWRDPSGFVELLLSATPGRLLEYAMSYQLLIRANRPTSERTISEIMQSWQRTIREYTPSPAAPAAMQVAA